MKRAASNEALIRKSHEGYTDLGKAYDASLHDKTIRDDLKVDIKNIFENLRLCLDCLAYELFEAFCKGGQETRLALLPNLAHSARVCKNHAA